MATKKTWIISMLVMMAMALGNAGSTLYLPAMPIIASHLGTTGVMMKLSLSLFLVGFALAQLFYGPLSDAFGRRINLFAGLVIFFLGSLVAACAHTPHVLLAGRLIEGLGIGAANAVGYALMRDIYSGTTLTTQLSYLSVVVGVTPLIAPIIGGYLVTYISWQACFYFLAICAFALFIVKWIYLPETLATMNPKACNPITIFKNYFILFKSPFYMGYAFATACAFGAVFTMGSMLPFLLVNQLHISVSMYGWIAGIPALGYMSGSFCGGKIAKKIGINRTILCGIALGILALIVGISINLVHFNSTSLIAPLVIFMLGIGMIMPTGSSGAMAPFPELAGFEAAILCASMFCMAAIFTAIGSHLSEITPIPLFSLLIGASILVLFFLSLTRVGTKYD